MTYFATAGKENVDRTLELVKRVVEELGIKNVIVPKQNLKDIVVDKNKLEKINVIPVKTIDEVLKVALDWTGKEHVLKKIRKPK